MKWNSEGCMQKSAIGAFIFLLFFVCTSEALAANEELAAQIKESIRKEFNKDPELAPVTLNGLTLIKESDSTYKGLLRVSSVDGDENITVRVTTDEDNSIWEIDK